MPSNIQLKTDVGAESKESAGEPVSRPDYTTLGSVRQQIEVNKGVTTL